MNLIDHFKNVAQVVEKFLAENPQVHKESLIRINDLKFNIECLEKNSNDWFAKQYGIEDSDVLVGQMYRFNEKSPCLSELIWG